MSSVAITQSSFDDAMHYIIHFVMRSERGIWNMKVTISTWVLSFTAINKGRSPLSSTDYNARNRQLLTAKTDQCTLFIYLLSM